METIDLPPYAPALMESTRAIGYSFETAIADILDNSITAGATKIDIAFFPIEKPYISILDNGVGMDREELITAMRYGSENPLNTRSLDDLGRFGMGLKTASMSQCRKLTVISKKNGAITVACWDLDHVARTGEWSLQILNYEKIENLTHVKELNKLSSGTVVFWENLDRMKIGELNFDRSMGKYIDKARDHLSLVFHRYISGEAGIKKIKLNINGIVVEAADPFLIKKSTQSMDEEIIYIEKEKILVKPYTLPHISKLTKKEIDMLGGKDGIRKTQGFYVYRNKRLLVWGTWFNLMRKGELSKLARVQIDIPNSLDSLWTLDIKKSMAVPPEVVRQNVAPIINRIGEASKRIWTYRGKKELDDSITHIWNRLKTREEGIVYELNRSHPLIENINEKSGKEKNLIEQLLKQIESNLPLNQLYIDLTNDAPIINESDTTIEEVTYLAKELLSSCNTENERDSMVQMLSLTEPFNQHRDILKTINEEAF